MSTVLINEQQIQHRVAEIGKELNYIHTDSTDVVCLPVLQGAIPLFADLSKHFNFNPKVCYVGASSYNGQQQSSITPYKLPTPDMLHNKHIILIDDILDSGATMNFFTSYAFSFGATSVDIVTLIAREKKPSLHTGVSQLIVGFTIGDEWCYGYGMDDEQGLYRTAQNIYKL